MAIARAPGIPVPWLQRVLSVIQVALPDSEANSKVLIAPLIHSLLFLPPIQVTPICSRRGFGGDATNSAHVLHSSSCPHADHDPGFIFSNAISWRTRGPRFMTPTPFESPRPTLPDAIKSRVPSPSSAAPPSYMAPVRPHQLTCP